MAICVVRIIYDSNINIKRNRETRTSKYESIDDFSFFIAVSKNYETIVTKVADSSENSDILIMDTSLIYYKRAHIKFSKKL